MVAQPFTINLVADVLFMPISAGLRNAPLAAADIAGARELKRGEEN